jgi:hypothetical protein
MNSLGRQDRRVQEGKGLEAALEFARYVFWSGIIELCEEYPQEHPLKVDGAMMRWKCEELQRKVQDRYRLNDGKPHIERTELEEINRKLDLIAGHVAKFSPPEQGALPCPPSLHVIDGGAK